MIQSEEDAHLFEAGRAADLRVAALDQTVRGHFGRMSATYSELLQVMWVNPILEEDACIEWLESGAVEEPNRKLHTPAAG